MTTQFFVPEVLPMAPRPHSDELLSSWLHRIAAANWLSLSELLDSVWRPGDCLQDLQFADYRMPAAWRSRLATLCRLPSDQLSSLELQHRFPGIDTGWFTYGLASLPFCASCCQEQHSAGSVYVRAEWCFVFQTHCPLHFMPLIDRCRSCGNIALPSWSAGLFRCGRCDEVLKATHFIPISPGVEIIVGLQQSIRRCLQGIIPPNRFWIGTLEASTFLRLVTELIQILLLPVPDACAKYVLADLLMPGEFQRAYNIGGRFDQPRFQMLSWFPRFKVMAALAQLLLGDRGKQFFEEPVCVPYYYLRDLFASLPQETGLAILDPAESWPEPLRSLFRHAAEAARPKRSSSHRPAFSPAFRYNTHRARRYHSTI